MSVKTTGVTRLVDDIAEIGGWRKLIGIEFITALFFTIFISIITCHGYRSGVNYSDLFSSIFIVFISVSGALLGFIIAAYALIMSAGSDSFKGIFRPSDFYKCLKVDFSWTSILIGLCILVSISGLIMSGTMLYLASIPTFLSSLFLFVWCIMNIIVLMTNSVRVFGDLASR